MEQLQKFSVDDDKLDLMLNLIKPTQIHTLKLNQREIQMYNVSSALR